MLGEGDSYTTMEEIRGWILTNHNVAPNILFPVINPNVAYLFYESEMFICIC